MRWELRRSDRRAVYDFTAIYTLVEVDSAFRAAAIAHDELSKLRAAMAGSGARYLHRWLE